MHMNIIKEHAALHSCQHLNFYLWVSLLRWKQRMPQTPAQCPRMRKWDGRKVVLHGVASDSWERGVGRSMLPCSP